MKYTKENIQEGLVDKINSLPIDAADKNWWKKRLPLYPKEIEQNILEWINNEPLTEVVCHGESIVRVLNYWQLPNDAIPDIICGFISYQDSDWRVSQHIWQSASGWKQ